MCSTLHYSSCLCKLIWIYFSNIDSYILSNTVNLLTVTDISSLTASMWYNLLIHSMNTNTNVTQYLPLSLLRWHHSHLTLPTQLSTLQTTVVSTTLSSALQSPHTCVKHVASRTYIVPDILVILNLMFRYVPTSVPTPFPFELILPFFYSFLSIFEVLSLHITTA